MSILNIKDPEAHQLATELAALTGKTLTQAVKDAIRESLDRRPKLPDQSERLVSRALAIGRRAAARPVLDSRPADEILGYGDDGTFPQ